MCELWRGTNAGCRGPSGGALLIREIQASNVITFVVSEIHLFWRQKSPWELWLWILLHTYSIILMSHISIGTGPCLSARCPLNSWAAGYPYSRNSLYPQFFRNRNLNLVCYILFTILSFHFTFYFLQSVFAVYRLYPSCVVSTCP